MTPKQQEQFNHMLTTLRKIAKEYETITQLHLHSESRYGLDYEEALEMAYQNIQAEAATAICGVRAIKIPEQ